MTIAKDAKDLLKISAWNVKMIIIYIKEMEKTCVFLTKELLSISTNWLTLFKVNFFDDII